jgi:mannose-1-phosphate guanylyltransferase
MRYAMIMAGGAGTRLWPMSRKDRPKQLLKFIDRPAAKGKSAEPVSLLALADRRLDGLVKEKNRYVCTAEAYRAAIRKDLTHYSDDQILGEPAARDTVNAIGLTAAVLAKEDKNAIFCVLTADHIIEPEETFRERMDLGFRLVEDDPRRLVTFSIKPTYAATGFGYVERGSPVRGVEGADKLAFHVERFVEKPDAARAAAYVASGAFAWNSGMFVWKASTFLEALERFKPESHTGLMQIQEVWGKKKGKETLEKVYPTLPKISVDYAVMEPATRESHAPSKVKAKDSALSVCTVLMDLKWLDVGSWPSYAETLQPDPDGNRTSGEGATVLVQGKRNLVVNARKGHTIAVLGAEDLIVVQTDDATLIMPRSKSEELKKLHEVVDERLK